MSQLNETNTICYVNHVEQLYKEIIRKKNIDKARTRNKTNGSKDEHRSRHNTTRMNDNHIGGVMG